LAAPVTMKGAVVSKAAAKLVKLGFAREIHAKPGTPLWRRDETGRSVALKLTAAGLKAIDVDEGPQDAIKPGEASQPQLLPEAKDGVSLDDVGRHAPLRRIRPWWLAFVAVRRERHAYLDDLRKNPQQKQRTCSTTRSIGPRAAPLVSAHTHRALRADAMSTRRTAVAAA